MTLIDAKNLILGRLASYAAQKAQLGEDIQIINCESAVVTGNKKRTLQDYREQLKRGSRTTGPFTPKRADRFVKKAIRGMLPYNKEAGKRAFKRIKCYIGTPEAVKDKKTESLKKASLSKLTVVKYITVKEICNAVGGKV